MSHSPCGAPRSKLLSASSHGNREILNPSGLAASKMQKSGGTSHPEFNGAGSPWRSVHLMKTSRIRTPSWARERQVSTNGIPADVMARLHAAHEMILSAVHGRYQPISRTLSSFLIPWMNSRARSASPGTTMLATSITSLMPKPAATRFPSWCTAWPTPFPGQTRPDDYLGLSLWLESDPEVSTFHAFRNTDSSAICAALAGQRTDNSTIKSDGRGWSPASWVRTASELRQHKALADCFHKLDLFSTWGFERFEEERFRQTIMGFVGCEQVSGNTTGFHT